MPRITKFRALYNRKTTDEYQIFAKDENQKSFTLIGTEATRKGAEAFVKILKFKEVKEPLFKIVKKRKKPVKKN